MLGTGPPPTEGAIDERGASVNVLLNAGRERRAAGGGVESEERSPATPDGNEAVDSTESRGWTACGGSRRLLCTPPERTREFLHLSIAWGMPG